MKKSQKGSSPDPHADRRYKPVQGLARGISILWTLRTYPAGTASASRLAIDTGLHRTTVKRLLETLCDTGFVQHAPLVGSYSLTFKVSQLGEAYQDIESIGDISRPFLRKLTEKVLWPCNIVTLDREAQLIVRESTHALSPLSFRGGALGQEVPILQSAVGRAYLAFCPEVERNAILSVLRASNASNRKYLAVGNRSETSIFEEVRRLGYALNGARDGGRAARFGAIAVPIREGSKVLGCINIVYLRSATSVDQMLKKHLGELINAAREIEEKFLYVKMERSKAQDRIAPAATELPGAPDLGDSQSSMYRQLV